MKSATGRVPSVSNEQAKLLSLPMVCLSLLTTVNLVNIEMLSLTRRDYLCVGAGEAIPAREQPMFTNVCWAPTAGWTEAGERFQFNKQKWEGFPCSQLGIVAIFHRQAGGRASRFFQYVNFLIIGDGMDYF